MLPALPPEPSRDADAVVGQRDPGAAGIVGIGLAAHEPRFDGLLDEARRPGLIHPDRLADLADREGVGCRGQRLEQPHPRRGGKARAAPATAASRSAVGVRAAVSARSARSTAPPAAPSASVIVIATAAVITVMVTVQPLVRRVAVPARTTARAGPERTTGTERTTGSERSAGTGRESPAATPQAGEGGGDRVEVFGSGIRHASNLHAT